MGRDHSPEGEALKPQIILSVPQGHSFSSLWDVPMSGPRCFLRVSVPKNPTHVGHIKNKKTSRKYQVLVRIERDGALLDGSWKCEVVWRQGRPQGKPVCGSWKSETLLLHDPATRLLEQTPEGGRQGFKAGWSSASKGGKRPDVHQWTKGPSQQ